MATASTSDSSLDFCVTCSSKHARIQPALCQCKHCSDSFCFDCMKEHMDEFQQNTAYILNRYNELKLLINNKRKLITEETMKSKAQMSEWLQEYIDNLTAEKVKIDTDIEKAEQDAQTFVRDIEVQLRTVRPYIETFTKTSIYQSEEMEKVNKIVDELIERISPLTERREYDLPSRMPKYKFEFEFVCTPVINEVPQTWKLSEETKNKSECLFGSFIANAQWGLDSDESSDITFPDQNSDISFPDEDYFCSRDKYERTSHVVNCMASDGRNIFYSTIEDSQHERIAYCYLDDETINYRRADPRRIWKQSHIVDIIWWESIDKFVCATENGIYTVEYLGEKFRISNAVKLCLTQVRIAANTDYIWIHGSGIIMVYNVNFQLVRSINFKLPHHLTFTSFCLTDNTVAIAVIRRLGNDRDVLQIEFYDHDMERGETVRLGSTETSCTIRTDGNDRYYVAVGQQRFYIVSSNGNKQTINLGKQANCLAVVNSRNIVLTKSRSNLELVRC